MVWFRGLFRSFAVMVVAVTGGFALVAAIFVATMLRGLPEVSTLKEYQHSNATLVYSSDGELIGEFTTERRYPVVFDKIPKHVLQAFLSAEDSNFYEHKGIDFVSIARAAYSNVMRGRYAQGGSTITQQVARALLLASKKKELTRKFREIVLAWRMEHQLSKDEILGLYLSEIYLGHGAFGIGAAAKNYFNKKVEELTVAEGAMLAGLPQRPNDWNPFHSASSAKRRQLYVLNRMVEEKYLDQAASEKAYEEPIKLFALEDRNTRSAPFVVEQIRQYLMAKYGSETILTKGFRVVATINYRYQKNAQRQVLEGLREVDKRIGWRGATENVPQPQWEAMRDTLHGEIVSQQTPGRILLGGREIAALGANAKLEYALDDQRATAANPYVGPTPVRTGEVYPAFVTAIADKGKAATIAIGRTEGRLAIEGAAWVLKPNKAPVTSLSEVFKVGDRIDVRVSAADKAKPQVDVTLEQWPDIQGALLSFDLVKGDVLAMVGGTDFARSKFNCALHAKRQVGSTFKPVLYAAAIDKGFSPSTLVTDAPIVFKFEGKLDADNAGEDWRPANYGGTFEGEIPLRLALIRSMNIPTVKLLNEITIDSAIDFSRKMGITANLQRDLSIALGSWSSSLEELTRTYAVFPRLGKPIALRFLRKVQDGDGKVLEENSPLETRLPTNPEENPELAATPAPSGQEAIDPATAYVMTDMLRGVVREGTGHAAASVAPAVAGKTGTSNDHRDAWFIGFTPQVMAGVWLGYEKDKPLTPAETGGKAAAPIWTRYMQEVVKDYPKSDFAIPDGVVFAYVDKETGRLAPYGHPKRARVAFKAGTVPTPSGDNILHIGEPGARPRAMSAEGNEPGGSTTVPPAEALQSKEGGQGYLRQGFDD